MEGITDQCRMSVRMTVLLVREELLVSENEQPRTRAIQATSTDHVWMAQVELYSEASNATHIQCAMSADSVLA